VTHPGTIFTHLRALELMQYISVRHGNTHNGHRSIERGEIKTKRNKQITLRRIKAELHYIHFYRAAIFNPLFTHSKSFHTFREDC
jgi:hypothetical protein